MQALVLVGGQGTRLRPLTESVPKPVLRLVDRPFISYMIEWLDAHGVEEVLLACGFMAHALREVLGDGEPGGPRVRYITEPEPRGTAGAIKFAEEQLEERFLALNGDTLSDLDLTALVRAHEEHGDLATLALHPVEDPSGYGLVRRGPDDEILEFLEKPDPAEAAEAGNEINAGAYVLERSILDLVPPDRPVSIEREVFPKLVGKGLHGISLDGYWMDIGTPQRYLQANWDILEGRVATRVTEKARDGVYVHPEALADPGQIEHPAFLDAGAAVEDGATVGPGAVLAPGCRVAAGAVITGSVLMDGCEVGEGARVEDSILGARAAVDPGVTVQGDVVAAS
jgi:mannose-1-phosphate guanylyltransferase